MTAKPYLLASVPLLAAGAVWPAAPPPPLAAAVLGALLIALGTAGWRLAEHLLPVTEDGRRPRGTTRVTAAFVFATLLATLPATLLGHFGSLRPGPFLLWVAALAVVAAIAPRPRAAAPPSPADPLGTLGRLERTVAAGALALLAVSALAQMRTDRYTPPGTYGFDDVSYHLATVATWRETGDLSMIRFDFGDPSTPFYPIVGELVGWTLLAPFRDLDVAARWAQLPFALATLAAMASIAGRLGLPLRKALPGLALYASLYRVFPLLALAAGNDHATAFFTLASVDGMLALSRRRTVGAGIYAGASVGLLFGTKYLGVLLALPTLAVGAIAWAVALRRERDGNGTTAHRIGPWQAGLVASGVAALAGGYTYLRNTVTMGNPLFPAPVKIAGVDLLPGWWQTSITARRGLPEGAIELPGFLFRADLWGTAPPWLLVTAAIAAPLACVLAGSRSAAERTRDAAVLLLPAAVFAVFLYLVHDHRDIRYLLPGIAVAALGWCYLAARADRLTPALGAALRIAACAAAVASLFEWQHLPGGSGGLRAAIALAAGALLAWGPAVRPRLADRVRGLCRSRGLRATAAAAALLVAWGFGSHVTARYPERRSDDLGLPRWLEDDVAMRRSTLPTGEKAGDAAPPGTGVAYVGYNTPYLYWGSRLQNRVAIVPTRPRLDRRLYGWRRPGAPRFPRGTYASWRRNLDRMGVEYVVVVRSGGEFPERRWMKQRPGAFERAVAVGGTEIWRVRPRLPRLSRPARSRR